ncbi:MAG: dienelactone hydrolase family protein [Planctomycetota bacterium]|jgi:dienelactone hydrolase
MHTLSLLCTTAVASLALLGCAGGGETPEPGDGGSADAAAPDIRSEDVSYEAGGVTLKGHLVYDAARTGPRPGVLVVHEWWGQNDYARMRARKLAELGYTALAVDMYGDGKTADNPKDAGALAGGVFGDIAAAKGRFEAARALLAGRADTDGGKIAAIGYCFGGGVILHMARMGVPLSGAASFHGSLGTKTPAARGAITYPLLICHGDADPLVPAEQVAGFKKEMAEAGATIEFHAYAGATHAFSNPAATEVGKKFGIPVAYDEAADTQSWAELLKFLERVFE